MSSRHIAFKPNLKKKCIKKISEENKGTVMYIELSEPDFEKRCHVQSELKVGNSYYG